MYLFSAFLLISCAFISDDINTPSWYQISYYFYNTMMPSLVGGPLGSLCGGITEFKELKDSAIWLWFRYGLPWWIVMSLMALTNTGTYKSRKPVYNLLSLILFPVYEVGQSFLGIPNWRRIQCSKEPGQTWKTKMALGLRLIFSLICSTFFISIYVVSIAPFVPDSQKGFYFAMCRTIGYRLFWEVCFNQQPFGVLKLGSSETTDRQTGAVWFFHANYAGAGVVNALVPGLFFPFLLANWTAFFIRLFVLSTIGEKNPKIASMKESMRYGKPDGGFEKSVDMGKIRAYDTQVEGLAPKIIVGSIILVYPLFLLMEDYDVGGKYLVPTLESMLYRGGILPVLGLFVSEHLQDMLAAKVARKYRGPSSGELFMSASNRIYERAGCAAGLWFSIAVQVVAARKALFNFGEEEEEE